MYNYNSSSPTVTNCTFSTNETDGAGGGMYNYNSSSPTVTNCTFSGNSASYGGGMYNEESSPTLVNCILWDGGDEVYTDNEAAPTVSYCDVQGGYSGTGNINADPLFVGGGDYHLQSGSPCIDAGNNAAPSLPSTDFEGDPRIVDGNGDTVAVVDMGADEYMIPPPPVGGELYPVNKLSVLVPWLTLALLLALGGGFVVMRRRLAR
jgi:parallel beta-helix repeat protein